MGDSIGKSAICKPQKPSPDFPLYPHASKRWAKKIQGKTIYFGPWSDPDGALANFIASRPDAGVKESGVTGADAEGVKELGVKPEEPKDKTAKPSKPYADFPLYPHNSKRWAKKIKGRTHFFGPWNDWQGALERFKYENDYLQVGKTPPPQNVDALTVGDLVNTFLENRESKVHSGEMALRTWNDSKRTGEFLVKELGRHTAVESLSPEDFAKLRTKMGKDVGLVSLGNEIQRARVIFNFAYKNEMIDRPIRMGLSFSKPSKNAVRKEKQAKAPKVFNIDELAKLYKEAKPQMRCFMLLALNGGLGPADIGQIEGRHIVNGTVKFPRPKTQVEREFPLWPETIKAIKEIRQTEYDSPLLFVTKYGQAWYKDAADSPITKEFAKLLKDCELHVAGRGFYALRHTFRTVADGCRDRVAIDRVMGHSDDSMGANYREWIETERLQAVVDHVRNWAMPMLQPKPYRPRKAR